MAGAADRYCYINELLFTKHATRNAVSRQHRLVRSRLDLEVARFLEAHRAMLLGQEPADFELLIGSEHILVEPLAIAVAARAEPFQLRFHLREAHPEQHRRRAFDARTRTLGPGKLE